MAARWFYAGMLIALLLLAACSSQPEGARLRLEGTRWQLVSLAGQPLVEGSTVSLHFDADQLGGSAGCNSYGGAYTLDGIHLRVGAIDVTAMACASDEIMAQERAYLQVLAGLQTETGLRVVIEGQRLVLYTRLGLPALEFVAQETFAMNPADLIHTAWLLRSVNGQPVEPGPLRTLSFASAAQLGGFAGCRHFAASYQAEADRLRLLQMQMLGTDCADTQQTTQEDQFTDLISRAEQFRLEAGSLEILTAQGDTATFTAILDAPALETTAWQLAAFVDAAPAGEQPRPFSELLSGSAITLEFVDGNAAGSAGCNRYFSAYTLAETRLVFTQPGATKMYCSSPDGLMAQETTFLNLLPAVQSYTILDRQLWLNTDSGPALIFTAPGTK